MEKLTEGRRTALREEGIFPYSRDFTNFFVFLGISLAAGFIRFDLSKEIKIGELVLYSIALPAGAALGAIFSTFVQSKFLIAFNFKANSNQRRSEFGLSFFFYSLIKTVIVLGAAILLWRGLQEKFLNSKEVSLVNVLTLGWQLSGGVLFLFALLGFIISRLQFGAAYTMSRQDMLCEDREGQMRPELRSATDRIMSEGE